MADTQPFQGTWISASAVDFAARAGQPTTVQSTLSDGIARTVSGTLHWLTTNGVGDLGYDEAASQGNSKFLYFYAVGQTGSDSTLSVVASDNDPSTGPTGRAAFKHVWTDYIDSSGNLLAIDQSGNIFKYRRARSALSIGVAAADAVVTLSLTAFVPTTAVIAELLLYYQSKGTRGKLIVWVQGQAGTGDIGDPSFDNNNTWHTRAANADNTFGSESNHTSLPLKTGAISLQYQPKSGCNVASIHVTGWRDGSVEAATPPRRLYLIAQNPVVSACGPHTF